MKKRRIFTAIAVIQIVLTMFYAGAQNRGGSVDFSADAMVPVTISDSNAYSLVGNVIFYHNGAVITCDSAIRYGERRMECYDNVVINQDSTYIYGDMADYNGLTNMVNVYSPIVKVVDGQATLYTRSFNFNTLDNIGQFGGGGIVRQNDIYFEAEDGYYYADTHDIIGSREVNMMDSLYLMSSDSVRYNTEEEKAYFFANTRIWNSNGDFLTADDIIYDTKTETYDIRHNAYILTEDQEVRADSMWYNGRSQNAIMYDNIQIFDHVNLSLAFGDYATYSQDTEGEKVLLTKNPSIASFEQGSDTLFMRADTMLLLTIMPIDTTASRSIDIDTIVNQEQIEENYEDLEQEEVAEESDDLEGSEEEEEDVMDDESTDINTVDESSNTLSDKELKALRKEQAKQEAELKKQAKREARQARIDEKMARRAQRMAEIMSLDSIAMNRYTPQPEDTVSEVVVEPEAVVEPAAPAPDTMNIQRRQFFAFGDVKAYRSDIQMICDSLVSYSSDSTIHLFGNPIMWNGSNQINSESAVVYSKNQEVDYMLFSGAPIMASQVDTSRYNQIKGREIMALFRNSEVYKVDVLGNGQTYYFMVDDSTRVATGFLVAESADISFTISDRDIETITFYTEPIYTIYPLAKVPETQSFLLPNFTWHSNLRPGYGDVIIRTVLDPIREEVELYERPDFSIRRRMDNLMMRFINRNEWIDREDELSPQTIEFMNEMRLQYRGINDN